MRRHTASPKPSRPPGAYRRFAGVVAPLPVAARPAPLPAAAAGVFAAGIFDAEAGVGVAFAGVRAGVAAPRGACFVAIPVALPAAAFGFAAGTFFGVAMERSYRHNRRMPTEFNVVIHRERGEEWARALGRSIFPVYYPPTKARLPGLGEQTVYMLHIPSLTADEVDIITDYLVRKFQLDVGAAEEMILHGIPILQRDTTLVVHLPAPPAPLKREWQPEPESRI